MWRTKRSAEYYAIKGTEAYERYDFRKAEDCFSKAIKTRPDIAELYSFRATARMALEQYGEKGKFEEAYKDALCAVRLNEKSSMAHAVLGEIYKEKKDYAAAIAECTLAVSCDSPEGIAYAIRGYAHFKLGNFLQARKDYETAVKMNNLAIAHNNLGDLDAMRGKLDSAMKHYEKALEVNPECSFAPCGIGAICAKKGRHKEAYAWYSVALSRTPHYTKAYILRGDSLLEMGEFERAIKDYTVAIGLKPLRADIYEKRAEAYRLAGDLESAKKDIGNACELSEPNR